MDGAAAQHLVVGTIQKPHGVRGELYVRVETDRPEAVFAPGRVLLLADPQGVPAGGVLTVERARPFKGGLLMKVGELTTREAAEEVRGRALLIPLAEAAPLEEGEVFVHELVGMEVRAEGEVVGRVHDVYEAPAGYLLAVRRPGKKGELMVPFVEAVVRGVDVEGRVLDLEPIPGLLEL